MAKLTRTQKFADLRENLANDKESSVLTNDISGYQNKLNSFAELANPANEEARKAEERIEEDPRYQWKEFDATPIDDIVSSFKNEGIERHIEDIKKEADIWNSIQEVHKPEPAPKTEPALQSNQTVSYNNAYANDRSMLGFYNPEITGRETKEEVEAIVKNIAEFLDEEKPAAPAFPAEFAPNWSSRKWSVFSQPLQSFESTGSHAL